jgi:hypothetical protein
MFRSNITAGLPNEKEGIREIPFCVAVIVPPKWTVFGILSLTGTDIPLDCRLKKRNTMHKNCLQKKSGDM